MHSRNLRQVFFFLLVFCCRPGLSAAGITSFDLGGRWHLTQEGRSEAISASVPGNVHLDLLQAGKISDPFFRDNEKSLTWVYEATWIYERSFDLPADFLRHDSVLLRCEGLDTVAAIEINGRLAGKADNMFRTWEFDVQKLLRPGRNTIRITFFPIMPYIKEFEARAPRIPNASGLGISNLRKAPYSNGWDFGPKFLTCGIYKKIELLAFDTARITDVRIEQDLKDAARARLVAEITVEGAGTSALNSEVAVTLQQKEVARGEGEISNTAARLVLDIPNPQLWWPAGMGGQPLYRVAVRLKDAAGNVLDATERRIGLREIKLIPKTKDRPLRLAVNGKEIFVKGANWIPSDVFPARVTEQKLRRYVADAAAVNMNMLRLWGGGYYEENALFDACDEKGILLWMDLKFACAGYPGMNPEFQDNIRAEIGDQLRRLRHHPSLAVICGNNEVHGLITGFKLITSEQYDHLFHDVIGKEVVALFPEANYVGGSPEAGDEHDWWVWHIGADFEQYLSAHGLFTEFGFQSFPEPATVEQYTQDGDRVSVLGTINKFHQKNGSGKGNETILEMMGRYFRTPKDFDSTLWLSQINQAYGMAMGIRHWRTDWPRSSGSIVWQYNDCWPGPTWSSIDYYGRWKAAQYAYRRVFAPVMVAGEMSAEKNQVQVKVATELPVASSAIIDWRLTDLWGQELASSASKIELPAGTASTNGPLLMLEKFLKAAGRKNALLWLNITAGNHENSCLVLFVRPKELALEDPKLSCVITVVKDGFDVDVTAIRPALWTWLTCSDPDARYSDNFFHLPSGKTVKIHITPSRKMSLDELRSSLRVRSLFDTF